MKEFIGEFTTPALLGMWKTASLGILMVFMGPIWLVLDAIFGMNLLVYIVGGTFLGALVGTLISYVFPVNDPVRVGCTLLCKTSLS